MNDCDATDNLLWRLNFKITVYFNECSCYMYLNMNNTAHGTVEWNMNDRWVEWRWIVERWKFFFETEMA